MPGGRPIAGTTRRRAVPLVVVVVLLLVASAGVIGLWVARR
jgi:hypothetical protein